MPASIADSIVLASNLGDFEDGSILPLFNYDSETESVDCPQRHAAILMAVNDQQPPPPDPFTTPIPTTASPEDLDNHHRPLAAAREKEMEERRKF
jgi:hypothetical protein